MKAIPLITSIPPRMSRRSRDGKDLGEEYGARCIASWKRSGFAPVTVNARSELAGKAAITEGVAQLVVDRDASEVTGKPHVFMSDLARAARGLGPGPVALVNADIVLEPIDGVVERLRRLANGEMLVAKRLDVDDPEALAGAEYGDGFDFFAANAEDFAPLEESRLIFGAPWWDHYLPLAMVARRARLLFAPPGFARHLLHEQKWSWDVWQHLGDRFIEEIAAGLPRGEDPADAPAREYARRLDRALASGDDGPMVERIRGLLRAPGSGRRYAKLRRVSAANIRFLDEVRDRA